MSWVKTITSPFKKARTLFNPNGGGGSSTNSPRDKKSQFQGGGQEESMIDLEGEVMNCGYEDVQVMWSILDKSSAIKSTL